MKRTANRPGSAALVGSPPRPCDPAGAWPAALLAALVLIAGCPGKPPAPADPGPAQRGADAVAAGSPGVAQPIGDDGRLVSLPNVTAEMLSAEFWIGRMDAPDEVRMSPDEVATWSGLVLQESNGALQDLAAFPESLGRKELVERTTSWDPGDRPLYRDGTEIAREELEAVALNRNAAAVHEENPVHLGATWQRCELRMWPTEKPAFETPDDRHFDVFQATALDPAEPLVVLHESTDGRWLFVRAYNCDGWLLREQVARVPDRRDWLSLVAPERFLVVIGSELLLGPDCGSDGLVGTRFLMGARLPLWPDPAPSTPQGRGSPGHHVVRLPERSPDGSARFVATMIPMSDDVRIGVLPYTRANVIRQAFRMLGRPYGWGGLQGGVDCSAFIAGVYRTLGIGLPRNSGRQELVPGHRILLGGPEELDSVPPASSLFLKGHTLLYLGEADGRHYAIHAMSAYMADGEKVPVFGVVVSDLSLIRTSGKSLDESLTSAVDMMPPGTPERGSDSAALPGAPAHE